MRRLILITDQRDRLTCFDTVERSRSFEFEQRPSADWKKVLADRQAILYFDIGCLKEREIRRLIRILESEEELCYGIVDPDGAIPDPADLFHGGASDYLGPAICAGKLPTSRYEQASEFYPEQAAEEVEQTDFSWADIREGEEYPFFFLYIELDVLPEWKSKSGSGLIAGVLKTFEAHLQRLFNPLGGRLWIKNEYGCLYLFPYSEGASDIIPVCMRLILNRVLISTEVYSYGTLLPYRFAFDSGSTVYRKEGDTGTLVSDAVNFIFHLGQQHTPEGHFVLSRRAAAHIPEGLQDAFVPFGEYHDQPLVRMKMPK